MIWVWVCVSFPHTPSQLPCLSGRVLPFTGAPCPFCPQKPLSQAIRASQGRDPWALGSRALLCSPCRCAVGVSGAAARMLTAQVSHLS